MKTPGEWRRERRRLLRRQMDLELQLGRLAAAAETVMEDLERHGPTIVPHLVDTDDNDGEYLRREVRKARKLCAGP